MKKKSDIQVQPGSGNIFADLGFAKPEQEQLKAELTLQIYRTLKQRGLTLCCRSSRDRRERATTQLPKPRKASP